MIGSSNEITAPSIMGVILCNQPAIRWLADAAGDGYGVILASGVSSEWSRIGFSTVGMFGTQWLWIALLRRMGVHVSETIYNTQLPFLHYGCCFHKTIEPFVHKPG